MLAPRLSSVLALILVACGVALPASVAQCPDFCPAFYLPVCGSDGVTYGNECELSIAQCKNPRKRNVTVAKRGRCDADCEHVCPTEYRPLCGSDFVTYNNTCHLERAQCLSGDEENPGFSHDGACDPNGPLGPGSPVDGEGPIGMPMDIIDDVDSAPPAPVSPSICPTIHFPVCASDGRTYENLCHVAVAHRETRTTIPVRRGACHENPTAPSVGDQCDFPCPLVFDPVCLPNGKVFENRCTYSSAFCRDPNLAPALNAYCDPVLLATAKILKNSA